MKLTKEDYMYLPKERLAELLAEVDDLKIEKIEIQPSISPLTVKPSGWGCDGTICTNPQMDCIGCPRRFYTGGASTSTHIAFDADLSAN